MRVNNARLAWAHRSDWMSLVDDIRIQPMSRSDCYEIFWARRYQNNLRGISPAYFTKLIFFCRPKNRGYILDQWTGKSANLIASLPIVELSRSGFVSEAQMRRTIMRSSVYSLKSFRKPASVHRNKLRSVSSPVAVINPTNGEHTFGANGSGNIGRTKSPQSEVLIKRDKVNLDIFGLKDEILKESANLAAPEVIATDLEAALKSVLPSQKDPEEVDAYLSSHLETGALFLARP